MLISLTISHILSGRNKPSVDFLSSKNGYIFSDLNLNWIVMTVGFMNKSEKKKRVESNY